MKIPMELWNVIEAYYKNNQLRGTPLASIDAEPTVNIQYWELQIKSTIFGPDQRIVIFLDRKTAESYIMANYVTEYLLTQSKS